MQNPKIEMFLGTIQKKQQDKATEEVLYVENLS
jgi:hypothetical protein